MKLLRRAAACALFLVSGSLLAEGIALKDVDGNEVVLSPGEIRSGYTAIQEPEGINAKMLNGDGTTAIVNPHYLNAGKNIPFSGMYNKPLGICQYFGFTEGRGLEVMAVHGHLVAAIMQSDGTLSRLEQYRSDFRHDIVRVAVCL